MMMPSIICLKTRIELWQTYAKCYYDYFMPAIALCDQSKKSQLVYTILSWKIIYHFRLGRECKKTKNFWKEVPEE